MRQSCSITGAKGHVKITFMKSLSYLSVLFAIIFWFSPNLLFAQNIPTVILESNSYSVKPGSLIELKVFSSYEQAVNVFDINIEYSSELFSFERAYTEGSVASIWKSLPIDAEDGSVFLLGGSTIPWKGDRKEIITLVFKARRVGNSSFVVKKAQFASADGTGTKIKAIGDSKTFSISEDSSNFSNSIYTKYSKIVGPFLVKDPQTDNSILVLDSTDPGSIKWIGVRFKNWLFWSDWQKTKFVSSLPGSAWTAQFKALGYDGKETVKTFYRWRILIIKLSIALLLVLLFILIYRMTKRRKEKNKYYNALKFLILLFLPIILFFTNPSHGNAASLSILPSQGTFNVGSTFDVQITLDTEGESVNALDLKLLFPPEIIQVVTPTTGKSIVGIWTNLPNFNNQTGELSFQGGIPNGINTSGGLVSNVTFRVRQTGNVVLKFAEGSRVLLNDGLGTDVLRRMGKSSLNFVLPPPEGPKVESDSHPDQVKWYNNSNVSLYWDSNVDVLGYSFVLDNNPISFPDNTLDSNENFITYENLESGIHYFHVKALGKDEVWGGTTHFSIKIDTTPPAEFPLEIRPAGKTSSKTLFLHFDTTDSYSGMDYYEYSIIPLSEKGFGETVNDYKNFFVEITSPEVIDLDLGKYDIVVRAYDKVGNFRDSHSTAFIKRPFIFYFSSLESFLIILIFIILLLFTFFKVCKWYKNIDYKYENKELPDDVKEKIQELKKYKKKYGSLSVLLLFVAGFTLFSNQSIAIAIAQMESVPDLSPPVITNISRNISNEDIFYIGGNTDRSNVGVNIYLQNIETNETRSFNVVSDDDGEWFYRHKTFLPTGEYMLWTQAFSDDVTSPPSSQVEMIVTKTAIQIGSSRLSFEVILTAINILLLFVAFVMFIYILFILKKGKDKHLRLVKETREAEMAVYRGFSTLRSDIESELKLIHKVQNGILSEEQKEKEGQLLRDLEEIERYVSKEVEDIEKYA